MIPATSVLIERIATVIGPGAARLEARLGFRRMSDEVVALFGPTGVGKTDVAVALADLLRVRGERPIAVSADALQVYEGLETLTGVADERARTRLEHRLLSFVPVTQEVSAGELMPRAHEQIAGPPAAGRPAARRRGPR